jgi:hypothetical protein
MPYVRFTTRAGPPKPVSDRRGSPGTGRLGVAVSARGALPLESCIQAALAGLEENTMKAIYTQTPTLGIVAHGFLCGHDSFLGD